MARTEITVSVIKDSTQAPFGNSDLEITETACTGSTGTSGNRVKAGKMTRLRFRYTGASGRVVTITSTRDPNGRTGDISATIGAGKVWEIDIPARGFKQTSGADKGCINFEAAHAEVVVSANHVK